MAVRDGRRPPASARAGSGAARARRGDAERTWCSPAASRPAAASGAEPEPRRAVAHARLGHHPHVLRAAARRHRPDDRLLRRAPAGAAPRAPPSRRLQDPARDPGPHSRIFGSRRSRSGSSPARPDAARRGCARWLDWRARWRAWPATPDECRLSAAASAARRSRAGGAVPRRLARRSLVVASSLGARARSTSNARPTRLPARSSSRRSIINA